MSKILYAGDSSLTGAAAYLAGVMAHHGLPFDYVTSGGPLGPRLARGDYGLYIFSDYPAASVRPRESRAILEAVRAGAGLLMIGGWASYHGLGGNWDRSPLAEALPVVISDSDDRVNSSDPVVLQKMLDHPIVCGLPFGSPPCVGGYNRFTAKRGAEVVLLGRHLLVKAGCGSSGRPGALTARAGRSSPLLVVGSFGRGRTAAFASDVAPHWVGPLVDWGAKRVTARAKGGHQVEVGDLYAEFFAKLLRWTAGDLS